MAHNLAFDTKSNQFAMFAAGKLPWHQLGQNVAEAVTWQEAMKLAHLDYKVAKATIFTRWSSGAEVEIPGFKAVVRLDNKDSLGIVGDGYQLIQNEFAFEFCDTLLEQGAKYESAGALGKGERIWCLARLPQADYSIGDDKHESYLLFTTAHDGSASAQCKLTDVRVVCQNTLTAALHNGVSTALKIRHTKSADEKLKAAQKLISGAVQSAQSLQDKLTTLAQWKLRRESTTAILDRLFPPAKKDESSKATETRRENVLADILALYEHNNSDALPEQRGTAYNLLNAITDYADHERTARITAGRRDLNLSQARAESALFGSGSQLKEKALEVIVQMADGSTRPATGADILGQILNNDYQN